jgi:hypothetical protein
MLRHATATETPVERDMARFDQPLEPRTLFGGRTLIRGGWGCCADCAPWIVFRFLIRDLAHAGPVGALPVLFLLHLHVGFDVEAVAVRGGWLRIPAVWTTLVLAVIFVIL